MIEGEKRAWQRLIDKFHAHSNRLTTYDFAHDPMFACEYRRLICDLVKKGYVINRYKLSRNCWVYQLFENEKSGQLTFI